MPEHKFPTPYIRWMRWLDLPCVLRIETQCFPNDTWTEKDFFRCMAAGSTMVPMVAEIENEVVGYMIYELQKEKLHIVNFAVTPLLHRHGIGRTMVQKMAGKLSDDRRKRIMVEVRETNLPAQLFFRAMGFRAVSILRGFYDGTPEDAYLMQYRYQPKTCNPLPANRVAAVMK